MPRLRDRIIQAFECCPDEKPPDCDTSGFDGCHECTKRQVLEIIDGLPAEVEKVNPDPNSWNFEHDSGWKDCKKAVLKVLR